MSEVYSRRLVYVLCMVSVILSSLVGWLGYTYVIRLREANNTTKHLVEVTGDNFQLNATVPELTHFYELKPSVLWKSKPDWTEQIVAYSINSDGIHSSREFALDKSANIYRILTVGDSFTFGLNVDTQDNYSERLGEMIQRSECGEKTAYEVLNLGVPGYDISYALTRLRLRGLRYKPDLIVWLINTHNIIPRDLVISRYEQLKKDLTSTEIRKQEAAGQFYQIWIEAQKDVITSLGHDAIMAYQQKYIDELAQNYKGPMVVLINDTVQEDKFMNFLFRVLPQHPNTIISTVTKELSLPKNKFIDSHPNKIGHTYIASYIYGILKRHNMLRCGQ